MGKALFRQLNINDEGLTLHILGLEDGVMNLINLDLAIRNIRILTGL